ncbi:MAG: hypothetical protein HYT81_11965 [Gemmatimonadetes bacterium]|nr:hypothetical protein [Gemmatimonadota bacterium]
MTAGRAFVKEIQRRTKAAGWQSLAVTMLLARAASALAQAAPDTKEWIRVFNGHYIVAVEYLVGCTDPKAANYRSCYVRADPSRCR